jgi:hypothetical protein
VQSENGPGACIIDCEGDGRGFSLEVGTADVTVDGFHIINGSPSGTTLFDFAGGGIYIYLGAPTISNCVITGCTVSNYGGGIMNRGADSLIIDCLISGNTSGNVGGGIRSIQSTPTITNCEIIGNNAVEGGGLSIAPVNTGLDEGPYVINCLIAANVATSQGGGLHSWTSFSPPDPVMVANCTFDGNSATSHGGGAVAQGGAVLHVTDSIFWNNTAANGPQISLPLYTSRGSTMEIGYSDVEGGQAAVFVWASSTLTWNPGNIDADPLIIPGPLGDYYLSQTAAGQGADSPCVDAGSDTAANLGLDSFTTRTDDAGDAGTVDMGYHY